jgi:hypothetical protein
VPLVPPQHGAWAFLGLPLVTALGVSPWTPVLVVLAVAWFAAYPVSYFLLALIRERASRRPDQQRLVRPLALWSLIALPALVVLVVARPWLLWVGLLLAVGFAVNIAYARRRDERALVNDAVFIAECTVMVPVTWAVAVGTRSWEPPSLSAAPADLWILTVAVALVLAGSTLHVKSLIRERADPRFARVSRTFALASAGASVALALLWGLPQGVFLIIPFGFLALRSVRMTGTSPRPGRIGAIELTGFLLLAIPAVVVGRQ